VQHQTVAGVKAADSYTQRLAAFLDRPASHVADVRDAVTQVLRATSQQHADFSRIHSVSQGIRGCMRHLFCYYNAASH